MREERVPAEEQYKLIMECRASGLSDHQWCLNNHIKPGTFYNWVKRLRKKGCNDIPTVTGQSCQESPKQEVVRLEFNKPPASVSSNSAPMYDVFCNPKV